MKRTNATIVIITYCMLMLIPPAIHVNCCADRHNNNILPAAASLRHPQAPLQQQGFKGTGTGVPLLLAMTANERSSIGAADDCPGHQCSGQDRARVSKALTSRYLSDPQCSQCLLCKTIDSIDYPMGWEDRFSSRDGPAVIPTAASLKTTVLLM